MINESIIQLRWQDWIKNFVAAYIKYCAYVYKISAFALLKSSLVQPAQVKERWSQQKLLKSTIWKSTKLRTSWHVTSLRPCCLARPTLNQVDTSGDLGWPVVGYILMIGKLELGVSQWRSQHSHDVSYICIWIVFVIYKFSSKSWTRVGCGRLALNAFKITALYAFSPP